MTTQHRSSFAPKSDQLNADDLVGGNLVIKITDVIEVNEPQQPVHIRYEGDNGKPYKPNKGMGRILEALWGLDKSLWVGHGLELYRDSTIKFGKDTVGGIRIHAMTGINKPHTQLVTVTRGRRVPVVIQPLVIATPDTETPLKEYPADLFEQSKNRMKEAIESGKSTVDDVIAYLEKTAPLTNDQKMVLAGFVKVDVNQGANAHKEQ